MTFIALEGCDGAGKSTLANALQEELRLRFPDDKIEYIHRSQLKRDPLDEYALDVEDYTPGQNRHIIADRWHWGETIYGPLYRHSSALDTAGFRWVELFLKARGAVVWHVSASLETIQERIAVRGEEYLGAQHVSHVWDSFRAVSEGSAISGGTAMTDELPTEELVERIIDSALYEEEQASHVFRSEYIGRSFPSVLLVGDKQGNGDPDATAAPFMPRGTSSGRFLLESLPGEWWQTVGIVNANETELRSLVADLMFPPIVALGRNASDALLDLNIEHGAVPHPSYIRRFHNKRRQSYAALIREVSRTGDVKLSWPS